MQVRRGEKMEVALEIRIMNCERGLDFYGAISCVVGLVLLVWNVSFYCVKFDFIGLVSVN